MNLPSTAGRRGFQDGVWPDALAFSLGLGLAWWLKWSTTDLVWSLWLASLVVGWAMIAWSIFGPMVFIGTQAWAERKEMAGAPLGSLALGGAAFAVGGLFMLAFFTVHFGFFHYVHSVFLQGFFPLAEGLELKESSRGVAYLQVFECYWFFLPAAFLAERHAFRLSPAPPEPSDTSVKAADIEARKKRNAQKNNLTGMMAPYRNVIRMHLLIFFFAAAHFARLENFAIYAVVYAVYFFPWRAWRESKASAAADQARPLG